MTNIYLLIIELLTCLLAILILYKNHKFEGLYTYSIIAFILANLMSLKTISIYSFDINLGIITFTSVFIANNIIIQKKGFDDSKKIIIYTVMASVVAYICFYLTSLITSSNINLFTNKSYDNLFIDSHRLYFANIATMLYILIFNGKLYSYLKRDKNKIWISNIFSGIIIQFISSCLFSIIAYALIKEPIEIVKIIIMRYMLSILTIIIGTIFIYIANKFKID
ncbi:MAG: queuosine precursor transporter [Bacilli bacterium]|nr:queuosine precursor transporter [Bacilli bacterium]